MIQIRSLTLKRIQQFSSPPETPKSIYDLDTAHKYINENIRKYDWPSYVIKNYYPKSVQSAFLAVNQFNLEL
jgi:NADH dehydrogenase [ubiquinone] 1 alpha subcomplex assembly factor 6